LYEPISTPTELKRNDDEKTVKLSPAPELKCLRFFCHVFKVSQN